MSLTLTVISYRQQPMARPLSERFEASRITLGRAPDNDWTLPDPDQLISKKHCTIQVQGGRYAVTDTSTNGVFVNGSPQAVGQGQSVPISDGDKLTIGGYEILVRVEGALPQSAAPPARAAAPMTMAPLDDPFGLEAFASVQSDAGPAAPPPFSAGASSASPFGGGPMGDGDNPFAIGSGAPSQGFAAPPAGAPLLPDKPDWLLDPGVPARDLAAEQFAQPDHLASEHVHYKAPDIVARDLPPAAGPLAIPENWDPLAEHAEPLIPILQPPPVVERMPARPAPPQPGPRIGAAPLEADAFMPPASAPRPALPPDFGAAGGQAAPRPAPLPPGPGPFAAPGGRPAPAPQAFAGAPAPAPARPTPAPAAASAGADGAALLAAFLDAAGIDPAALRDEPAAAVLAAAGRTLRDMALGLKDALTARAMIKTEYRVEQTVIRAANNNPFKFAADPEHMLAALLTRPRQGYMPGSQAVQEGFKDLRAHELALLAGMQAAVNALLRQFDPEQLKQRLEQQSILQNLLPGARKAKYWEIYEQHYKQIAADVSEDVRGTFGRAFANAYEEQAKKL